MKCNQTQYSSLLYYVLKEWITKLVNKQTPVYNAKLTTPTKHDVGD